MSLDKTTADLERLLKKATPGSWTNCDGDDCDDPSCTGIYIDGRGVFSRDAEAEERANAELAVAAVNALPELLAAARRLERELEQSRETNRRLNREKQRLESDLAFLADKFLTSYWRYYEIDSKGRWASCFWGGSERAARILSAIRARPDALINYLHEQVERLYKLSKEYRDERDALACELKSLYYEHGLEGEVLGEREIAKRWVARKGTHGPCPNCKGSGLANPPGTGLGEDHNTCWRCRGGEVKFYVIAEEALEERHP